MPLITPTTSRSEEDITVSFGADTSGYEQGVDKVKKSAQEAIRSADKILSSTKPASNTLNEVLFGVVKAGNKVRLTLEDIGNVIKRVLIGGMLIFAISVHKIFSEIRDSVASAVELAGGKTKEDFDRLKGTITEIKEQMGLAFLPILQAVLPYLQKFADWLLVILNKVAMIVAAWMGQKQVLQVLPGSAAKLAKETEKAKKAAQGFLAAFDQINVLGKSESETTGAPLVSTQMVPVTDDILKKVQDIKDTLSKWFDDPLGKLEELGNSLKDKFLNYIYWDNWKRFAVSTATEVGKAIEGTLASAAQTLPEVGKAIEVAFSTAVNTASVSAAVLGKTAETSLATAANLAGVLGQTAENALANIVSLASSIGIAFQNALTTAANLAGSAGKIFEGIPVALGSAFSSSLEMIKASFKSAFGVVYGVVRSAINSIIDLINSFNNVFVDSINSALSSFNSVAGGVIPGFREVPLMTNYPVPHLANGAVIPPNSPMLAMVGDNKTQSEIIAPEDKLTGILEQVLDKRMQTIENVITLDGEVLYRSVNRVDRRRGTSLITSGVTR